MAWKAGDQRGDGGHIKCPPSPLPNAGDFDVEHYAPLPAHIGTRPSSAPGVMVRYKASSTSRISSSAILPIKFPSLWTDSALIWSGMTHDCWGMETDCMSIPAALDSSFVASSLARYALRQGRLTPTRYRRKTGNAWTIRSLPFQSNATNPPVSARTSFVPCGQWRSLWVI